MEIEEKLEIAVVPLVDKLSGEVTFQSFDKAVEETKKFVKELSIFVNPAVYDEEEIKLCKKERAKLNSALKAVQTQRKKVTELAVGTFESQCKEIEKILKQASDLHSESINKLNTSVEIIEPHSMTLTIECKDEESYQAIKKYAAHKGAVVK